jgi:tetrapyrrole methylase family protein/MazG family protein
MMRKRMYIIPSRSLRRTVDDIPSDRMVLSGGAMQREKPEFLTKEKCDINDLQDIVKALRAPGGCPWDRKQTHGSIGICMIEEAAESVDAVRLLEREQNPDSLREELGDVLFQVVLHSAMAEEEGYFTFDDVVDEVSRKMLRRHPHVFGSYEKDEQGNEVRSWDEIKKREVQKKTYTESERRKKRRKRLAVLFYRLLIR